MERYYKIADLIVKMDTFGRTEQQAAPYEIPSTDRYDFEVISSWKKMKPSYPYYTDDVGEYYATECNFYNQMLLFHGFRLHSSAVVVDGKAYLFSAVSGTGKSTHTQLWLDVFGDRAYILNDDKPALRLIDGIWYAYGTPWSGKYDISVNKRIPIAGIAMLERAPENEIFPYNEKDIVYKIMKQSNRPMDMEKRIRLMELLDHLITNIPIWKLRCNMEDEAAIVSYEAMSGQKFKEN